MYIIQYILTYIQIKQKEEPNFFNAKNCKKNKNNIRNIVIWGLFVVYLGVRCYGPCIAVRRK